MTPPCDLFGKWWLPEHEEHKVFGTLTWDPEDGGTLQLHGELRPFAWKDNILGDGSVQRYRELAPRRTSSIRQSMGKQTAAASPCCARSR